MSSDRSLSDSIAAWLSRFWCSYKPEQFYDHFRSAFQRDIDTHPNYECLYIAEAEFGDLDAGSIGGIIRRWWQMDDEGLRVIASPISPSTDESNVFYRRPFISFFTDGTRVVIGERLGPDLLCRKVGRIHRSDGCVSITDIEVLWKSG